MKPKTVRVAALLAALLVVAAGCWNPTGEAPKAGTDAGSEAHGLVVLQFHDLRSLTITPEISLEIESYEVSFTRSGFQPVTVGGVPGDTTQTDPVSLLPGPWQVTVSAVNDETKVIGFGEREVSVAARQTTTAGISIRSLSGEGTLSLTAEIGALEIPSPSISGTLTSGGHGQQREITMSIDGSSASFEESLEAGTYQLSLELFESETPIAGFVNAVLIVYEETTSAAIVFRPFGGTVVAELVDEITRPIPITLEGLQETLTPEESMTVRAETAGAVDSYQWYLGGYAIPGEDEQEITLGPGMDEGEYVLTVVVQRGEIQSAEAGVFTVVESEPHEFDLTGYWDAYTLVNGELDGPHLVYFRQTGNTVKTYDGTGTVDGSTLAMSLEGGQIAFSGTIESEDVITGTVDFYGTVMGSSEIHRVDEELEFGAFSLWGDIELDTQEGLGGASDDVVLYELVFDIDISMLEGFLTFENTVGLGVATYDVVPYFLKSAGPGEVNTWFCDSQIGDIEAEHGQLQIDTYSPDAVSGDFILDFDGGNWFAGSFDLTLPEFCEDCEVTITGGHWFGENLEEETRAWVGWRTGQMIDEGGFGVYSMNEDGGVWLELYPQGPIGTGVFEVPEGMDLYLNKLTDHGDEIECEAVSGELTITGYEEGVGMAGYFDQIVFEDEDGASYVVSGAFDVSFEMTRDRWSINF